MSDKEMDLDKIIKLSFLKAQKELGLLKEQDEESALPESVFIKPFDENRDMPEMKIRPTEWGLKTSIEAQQIDSLIEGILSGADAKQLAGAKSALQRYKLVLELLNETLETEASAFAGLKPAQQKAPKNARAIVTSLQAKSLMAAILRQSPQAAGKMYEGLIARMVGGFTNNPSDEPIEDFFDDKGNPISLKVIRSGGDVEGSKLNLARGIQKYEGITYLVNVKNSDNPFNLEVFSFTINKSNYFYFIYGINRESKLTPELRYRMMVDMRGMINRLGVESLQEAKKDEDEPELSAAEKKRKQLAAASQADVINAYFQAEKAGNENLPEEEKNKLFKDRLDAAIKSIDLNRTEEEFYNRAAEIIKPELPSSITGANVWKGSYENLKKDLFFGPGSASPFKIVTWKSIQAILSTLLEQNNELFLAAVFSENSNIREKAFYYFNKERNKERVSGQEEKEYNAVKGLARNSLSTFIGNRDALGERFRPFRDFIEQMEQAKEDAEKEKINRKTAEMGAGLEKHGSAQQYASNYPDLSKTMDIFWNAIQTGTVNSQDLEFLKKIGKDSGEQTLEEAKKESAQTAFKVPISTVKAFAKQNVKETNYDDTYPKVIVGETEILKSGQANAKLFRDTIKPFYESLHYITQGINAYFVEDKQEGLTVVNERGITPLTAAVSSAKDKKASDLQESKDDLNNLTKEAKIVMEMLKRMED